MKRRIHPRVLLPVMAYLFSSLALSSAVEATSTEATITGHLRRRRLEEEVPTDAGDDSGGSSGGDGGIPLSGEFFLMFFYVVLIVFAVLFLPVIWKCAKNAVGVRRKVGLSNGDEEGCCAERTKDDILAGVEEIKQKIAEESRKVRYGATPSSGGKNNDEDTSSSSSTDAAAQNEETNGGSDHLQMPQTKRNDSTRPMSGLFYGTYYYKNKARMTPMELTFAPHPRGGYVILGSGQVQSGPTELSEGYLNPSGEAYFVEVGGINPTSVDLDVTKDDLTSRRLAESEVTSLLVLYRGKFDFSQHNIVFKGWRYSSTGISRIYHLLRRPRESKIRHVMSTIGSPIHSVGRRRSSAIEGATDEDETKDEELGNASGLCEETKNQSSQQQNGAFALSSSSEGLT